MCIVDRRQTVPCIARQDSGMTPSLALGAFALGFLGSAHCAAMCGGFALSGAGPARPGREWLAAVASLHGGRVTSYATAGAAIGALGGAPASWLASSTAHGAALAVACIILFATGVRLSGLAGLPVNLGLARGVGRLAVRAAGRIGPPRTSPRRFALGALWGWAPCALVYAALPIALVSGSAAAGALVMACFALGTLPALLGAVWVLERIGAQSRRLAGALLMGLALATFFASPAGFPLLCLT
jgi:sulfite exporter TauE/SafE